MAITSLDTRHGSPGCAAGVVLAFWSRQLLENFRAVIDEVTRAKPAASKGRYILAVTLSSSQGPGVKVDPARLRVTGHVPLTDQCPPC